ncbi:DUF4177 domain-containing protein [uncultured Tateyamaria sp.]|uniref:DUF4177 domain-containing protein n=1 Tax=uncultured Tateyamaria sp. TaxID=455651 RepID=UPI00260B8DB0|nr:DUF4177 domain-containing protein [uncultured Tateyamaria sp.]
MPGWEYKVVPAPTKGVKAPGVKGPEARFANALETLMNEMGSVGWEYQRAETLPSVERSGLTGSTTEWRNILVFRRATSDPIDDFEPELLPAPAPDAAPEPPETTAPDAPETTDESPRETEAEDTEFVPGKGATEMQPDNGVEETSEVAGMTTSLKSLASQRSGKPDAKNSD